MIETCEKMKDTCSEFDYCWWRFAMSMSEAKSALEDTMSRLMSPILSSVVQHFKAEDIREELRTCFYQIHFALAHVFMKPKRGKERQNTHRPALLISLIQLKLFLAEFRSLLRFLIPITTDSDIAELFDKVDLHTQQFRDQEGSGRIHFKSRCHRELRF